MNGRVITRLVDTVAAWALLGALVGVLLCTAVVEAGQRRWKAIWLRVIRASGIDAAYRPRSIARHMPLVWTGFHDGSVYVPRAVVVDARSSPDAPSEADEIEALFI